MEVERKLRAKYLTVAMLLLLLFQLTSFAVYSAEESLEKPEEVIRMALFVDYHPAFGSWVTKTLDIWFEDIEGFPIATNGPAFGDGFKEAHILYVSYGAEGFAIRLVIKYEISVDNKTANEYALMVSDEVMNVINKTSLPIHWTNTRIDNATRIVTIDRGLLPRTLSSIKGLLEYLPKDGFGSLITEKLLEKFVPGEIHEEGPLLELGLSRLRYTLLKINDSYRWYVIISFGVRTSLGHEEWIETLDLNSLVFHEGPIEPSVQRTSRIIVEMPKRRSIPTGNYETNFETVYPAADVEEKNGWLRVDYQVTTPINNFVAKIKISKLDEGFNYGIPIIVGLVILAILVIAVIFFRKKRKGGEKA